MNQGRGFTLIELMISIAIVAITLSIATSAFTNFVALSRALRYERSLNNAEHQLEYIRSQPFGSVPPQVVQAKSDGTIHLSQRHLVEGTVEVLNPKNGRQVPFETVSLKDGTLRVNSAMAGKKLVVDYQFTLPDRNESHFVRDDRTIQLQNRPVIAIDAVFVADGEKLRELSDYELSDEGVLTLPKLRPGQLVVVDYLGEEYQNRIEGEFLGPRLRARLLPTETKRLVVGEKYSGGWRLSLPLFKEQIK